MDRLRDGRRPLRAKAAKVGAQIGTNALGGTIAAVVGGLALAALLSSNSDVGATVPPGPTDPTVAGPSGPSSPSMLIGSPPTSLEALAANAVVTRPGTVAGVRVPASPTYRLTGSQCNSEPTAYVGRAQGEYTDITFVAAVDDSSPDRTRVDVRLTGDGELLDQAVVERGTTGATLESALEGFHEIRIEMTALTRAEPCEIEKIEVHLMDGTVR